LHLNISGQEQTPRKFQSKRPPNSTQRPPHHAGGDLHQACVAGSLRRVGVRRAVVGHVRDNYQGTHRRVTQARSVEFDVDSSAPREITYHPQRPAGRRSACCAPPPHCDTCHRGEVIATVFKRGKPSPLPSSASFKPEILARLRAEYSGCVWYSHALPWPSSETHSPKPGLPELSTSTPLLSSSSCGHTAQAVLMTTNGT
jgi:hypothetical protein